MSIQFESITGETEIQHPRLSIYFSQQTKNVLQSLNIKTVRDFIRTPISKFELIATDIEMIKKAQLKLSQQIIGKQYTLKQFKDAIEMKVYSTGIESIDSAIPEKGLVKGKCYDIVGNIDGPLLRVVLTMMCSYLIQTEKHVLWIDTIVPPNFDVVYDILLNQFDCEKDDIINKYFKLIHIKVEQTFYELHRDLDDLIEETDCEMIIFNSLAHLLQSNLLFSSPLYLKTVQWLTHINKLAHENQLIIINVNFLQMIIKQNPHKLRLIETLLKSGFYAFPDIQLLMTSQDNTISAYLTKPKIVITD